MSRRKKIPKGKGKAAKAQLGQLTQGTSEATQTPHEATQSPQLTPAQQARFEVLDAIVVAGKDRHREWIAALREIHQGKLYLDTLKPGSAETFKTFEEYITSRTGQSASWYYAEEKWLYRWETMDEVAALDLSPTEVGILEPLLALETDLDTREHFLGAITEATAPEGGRKQQLLRAAVKRRAEYLKCNGLIGAPPRPVTYEEFREGAKEAAEAAKINKAKTSLDQMMRDFEARKQRNQRIKDAANNSSLTSTPPVVTVTQPPLLALPPPPEPVHGAYKVVIHGVLDCDPPLTQTQVREAIGDCRLFTSAREYLVKRVEVVDASPQDASG